MKKQLLFIAMLVFTVLTVNAQNSITVTSVVVVAEVVTVNYTYTSDQVDNYIYTKLSKYADTTFDTEQAVIIGGDVASSPAATGGTGSIALTVPSGTTLTAALVSPVNYKISIEMKEKVGWTLIGSENYATEVDVVAVDGGVAAAISFTTAELTTAEVGSTVTVGYQYSIAADGIIYCAINQYSTASFDNWVATIVDISSNPAVAGTDVTGSFDLEIPGATVLTSALTSPNNYKMFIKLNNAAWVEQTGVYPSTEINLVASGTIGINDIENDTKNLSVYPNPVSNELSIGNVNMSEVKNIRISNILGEVLVSKSSFETNKLDVSNLVQGVYCIIITSESGTTQTKFIKK
jgi:hypothetical protein